MNLTELKKRPISDLVKLAETMGLENMGRSRKQDIIFGVLKAHARKGEDIYGDGVLEILQDGFGFLRSSDSSYLAGPGRHLRLARARSAASICAPAIRSPGLIRPPKDGERYFALLKVGEINYDSPESSRGKVLFENLTPLHPTERLKLERGNGSTEDLDRPRHRSGGAHRQGPARPDRLAAEGRQDHAAAEHRDRHHGQSSRGAISSCC